MIETVRDFFHDSCANDDFNVLVRRKGEQREQDLDLKTEASSLLGSKSTYERSLPAIIHPFRLENFGISVSYFNTGICVFLLPTPVTYYLIDTVGVSSGQLSAFLTLVYLPWSMKFLFGILTDSIVILGSRRKSWMLIGWSIFIFLNIVLFFIDEPGLVLITSLMFLSTSAYLLSDVCNDAQSIERSKFECLDVKGSYQTTIYIIRAFGMIISSIQAALLYNTTSWGWGLSLSQLFLMSALIPLTTVMPFSYFIVELKSGKLKVDDIKYTDVPSVSESWQRIWDLLQLRAIWYPLIFFVPYNCFLLSNGAWSNYLVLSLEFTDFALGVITISGAATYFLVSCICFHLRNIDANYYMKIGYFTKGMMFFQRVVFRRDWREIMIWCTVLYSLASLAQVYCIFLCFLCVCFESSLNKLSNCRRYCCFGRSINPWELGISHLPA